jgi:hypothetical protein
MNMQMNARETMNTNLVELLSKLILENDDDTVFRFQAQDEALNELKCSQPSLGEWIDRCDYSFLMDTLKLSDRIFLKEFPSLRLPLEERKQFAETLAAHCENCVHCFRKRAYDLKWESCVDKTLDENRETIGKALGYAAGKN